MTGPTDVRIVEVGPRDGLQNEPRIVPAAQRIRLIDALSNSGLSPIEAGSFVSPQRIPQMADTEAVLVGIGLVAGVRYPILLTNVTRLARDIAAGLAQYADFPSPTQRFRHRHTKNGQAS